MLKWAHTHTKAQGAGKRQCWPTVVLAPLCAVEYDGCEKEKDFHLFPAMSLRANVYVCVGILVSDGELES